MNRDNGFGDAFAQEVLNIMNSKEHKEVFAKTAQLGEDSLFGEELTEEALGRGLPERVVEGPVVQTPEMKDWGAPAEPVGGVGETLVFPDPGVDDATADAAVVKAKAFDISQDVTLPGDVAAAAAKAQADMPLSAEEKALIMSYTPGATASNKEDMQKAAEEKEWEKYGISEEEWANMTEFEKEIARKTHKKGSGDIMTMIVAVGDLLGKGNYPITEKIADRLLNSFIVEASNKTAGDKCKECECEPCECEKEEDKKKE